MGVKFIPIELSKIQKDKSGFAFRCPACGHSHFIQTNRQYSPCWNFNNDVEKPTVSPSIKVTKPWKEEVHICHFFIKNGKIQFCNDCTHDLKGKTIDLPDWDE